MTYLFSYGSNHPAQLAERLGHPVLTLPAYLPGFERHFVGWSTKWSGGVASIKKRRGGVVYGLAAQVDEDDLLRMDRFEGVPFAYLRIRAKAVVGGEPKTVVAYRAIDRTFARPSRSYLEAVARTIGAHWTGEGGARVTADDIKIR